MAREHLSSRDLVVVVAGDARTLRSRLQAFGKVTVVDAAGDTLTAADLAPPTPERPDLDASRLVPGRYRYRILFQGQPVGTMVRDLVQDTAAGPAALAWRGTATMGPQTVRQEVVFTTPGFQPLRASATIEVGGRSVGMRARIRDGRLLGTTEGIGGGPDVDRPIPPGALLGDMVELAVWIADLAPGAELSLPVVQLQTGVLETTPVKVAGTEEVTVPAGTFDAYRVDVGGSGSQTVWARRAAPHVILKVVPKGQPVTMELEALPDASGGGRR